MIRRVVRRAGSGVVALGLALGVPGVAAGPVAAAPSRAVVIVDTGSSVRTEVISFSGSISGLEALRLAGADPVTYGYAGQGAGVCALDGVGHAGTDECLGTADDPRYWSYWHATDGASGWSYARECACTFVVHDGDVEGWKFGTGARPPFRSFCDVVGCAPQPAPDPTPEPGGPAAPAPAPVVGPGAAGGPGGPTASDPAAASAAPTTTLGPAPTVPTTTASLRVSRSGARRAADPGSPTGLLVALGVAVAAVVATVVRRRRPR